MGLAVDGDRLRYCRALNGLTQDEASAAAGISPGTWKHIQNGRREPHLSTLRKMAKSLAVEPRHLLRKVPSGPA